MMSQFVTPKFYAKMYILLVIFICFAQMVTYIWTIRKFAWFLNFLGGFAEYVQQKTIDISTYTDRSDLGPMKFIALYKHLISIEKYEEQILNDDQVGGVQQ